jgi:hypothetical protein
VVQQDRKAAGKVSTVAGLIRQQAAKNHSVIPGSQSLQIDNTQMLPGVAAEKIMLHFKLKTA